MTKELPYKKVIKESSQKCKKTNIYNDVRQLINKKFCYISRFTMFMVFSTLSSL